MKNLLLKFFYILNKMNKKQIFVVSKGTQFTTAPLQRPSYFGISFDILSKLFCISKGELHLGLHSVHVGYIYLKYKYIIGYFMNI